MKHFYRREPRALLPIAQLLLANIPQSCMQVECVVVFFGSLHFTMHVTPARRFDAPAVQSLLSTFFFTFAPSPPSCPRSWIYHFGFRVKTVHLLDIN